MTHPSSVLATRCPHCHTVFRVVADQLKLRDGLVRCGTCREVFDGQAYLCEPPGEARESETASTDAMLTPHADAEASADVRADITDTLDTPTTVDSVGTSDRTPAWPASPTRQETPAGATLASAREPAAQAERAPVPEMLTPTAIAALLGTPDESRAQMRHGPGRYMDDDDATALTAPTASMASSASAMAADSPTSARLAGQPPRPGAGRVIWRVLITLAIAALLAQWAWIERAGLVDRAPALRSVFAVIGRSMRVTIAPPRQPDKVQISSVTLITDAPGATDAATGTPASDAAPGDAVPMTLTVFIRNQADYAVAWPSLELTLSDIDGKPVVRRVFSASDYVADATQRAAGLAPHNERTIRLRLTAQAALASNYRVLAFYP
ncbi:DUF3426 domain-containing protein [Pandoraea terrigena]|uniref:Zinc finger/thioredoxin putative domain-containing protein n=1 Tax=Pandoraea terrigena TaxID=2508292 RepID=A0A5E4TNE9_9BURK|nr:DUF3426 domain-containing protein [Pandoraea terrigena]VVD87699.1 hypothetical protein PTE31013_01464 [Pandoraea terrigena]